MGRKKKEVKPPKLKRQPKPPPTPWPKGFNKPKTPEQIEIIAKHETLNKQFNAIFDHHSVKKHDQLCGDWSWYEFSNLSVEEKQQWLADFHQMLREDFGPKFTLLKLVK